MKGKRNRMIAWKTAFRNQSKTQEIVNHGHYHWALLYIMVIACVWLYHYWALVILSYSVGWQIDLSDITGNKYLLSTMHGPQIYTIMLLWKIIITHIKKYEKSIVLSNICCILKLIFVHMNNKLTKNICRIGRYFWLVCIQNALFSCILKMIVSPTKFFTHISFLVTWTVRQQSYYCPNASEATFVLSFGVVILNCSVSAWDSFTYSPWLKSNITLP